MVPFGQALTCLAVAPAPTVFQSFLTSTESRLKSHGLLPTAYANLMYERASNSKPPCILGILTSADFFWKQSNSPTRRTFYGNSYTAPTPSIHTIQQHSLAVSKSYRSLLTNATRTFQRPPTAPQFDLYSFLAHSEDM